MSAPVSQLPSSSTSSTGHVDGLGRRSLAFDRVTGAVLERLHLRPELTVFEQLLRRRVESLVPLEDDRFARPSAVERDPATGELTVVAEFVTGTRLSDLLETSADAAVVPGVDVALGYLLEALPALSGLHTVKRVTHGLIDPSRTVLTTDGQVVLLDVALGPAIERLKLSPSRLWNQFGVTGSPGPDGSIRFDPTADVTQAALSALMLILGRNLRAREYPDALSSLLLEVIEVAQIRGSSNFAGALQRFFQRALPLPDRRPYASADEALVDVRQLVNREIGSEVCRQAVIDFVDHMDAAFTTAIASDTASLHGSDVSVPELDRFLDDFAPKPLHVEPARDAYVSEPEKPSEETSDEVEISLDNFDVAHDPEPARAPVAEEVYDLPPLDLDEFKIVGSNFSTRPVERVPSPFAEVEARPTPVVDIAPAPPEPIVIPEPARAPEPEPFPEPESTFVESDVATPAIVAVAQAEIETESEPEKESASSRRKKRQQQRSARARKDKLRSSTADQKMPIPEPVAAKPASPTGWLVSPQRSAVFEPVLPEPPAPVRTVPLPAVPSFTPSPVGHLPQPVYAPQAPAAAAPAYGTPMVSPHPPAPSPLVKEPITPPATTIKVKPNPPTPSTARKTTIAEPVTVQPPVERYGTMAPLGLGHSAPIEEAPRQFPWKLAAVALLVAVVAIVAGRQYLPGRTAVTGEPGAKPAAVTTPPPTPAPAVEEPADSSIPGGRGRLVVTTQPAGIKVLIDKKPAGETPLNTDLPAGRHTLTFQTSGGEVVRPVRIVAGKSVTLDIPVFSGWLSVIAPIILDVAENGQSIGTTEQNRLTLPPGHHQLTLSNKDLGYSGVQEVEIEPGGVKSLTIEPKGTVNLNASPWAEVWLDGQKLGDTPLVTQVTLGTREFVFKHPQRGERRQSATIRASATTPVSVDFNK
jgi:PEGA domain